MEKNHTWRLSIWDEETYQLLVQKLVDMQDMEYLIFHSRLVPEEKHLIGIRLPQLHQLAGEIARGTVKEFLELKHRLYIKQQADYYYEERMLEALVIGKAKLTKEQTYEAIRAFLPKITNWAVCDSFCTGLKFTKKNKKEMYQYVMEELESGQTYHIRFALVMLLNYYVEKEYLEEIFRICEKIKSNEYYVKMAVAWLLSICFIKFRDETEKYLEHHLLDEFTYKKTIQKICDSYRVTKEDKERLRNRE